MANNSDFLTRKQAAAYLQDQSCSIVADTLKNMAINRNAGRGPPFYRDGGRILYRREDLDEWRRKRLMRVE